MIRLAATLLGICITIVCSSQHYHIVPDTTASIDLCSEFPIGTCSTLDQFAQADIFSDDRANLTLTFLEGDHVLTQLLTIHDFLCVQIIGCNYSVLTFNETSRIEFSNITKLSVDHIFFIQYAPFFDYFKRGLSISTTQNVFIYDSYIVGFEGTKQDIGVLTVSGAQNTQIENVIFLNNSGRALFVESENVKIKEGKFEQNSGAIFISATRASISNTEFIENLNGAILINKGIVNIANCELANNQGLYDIDLYDGYIGGAIVAAGGNLTISNSTFYGNSADLGGAILVIQGSLSLSNSALTNNRALEGGALFIHSSDFLMTNCTVTNNRNHGIRGGGAIFGTRSGNNLSISRSDFVDNNSINGYGGVILVETGALSISNSRFMSNTAYQGGGSIMVEYGNVSISDSDFKNNVAAYGGGFSVWYGNVYILNCTFNNNSVSYKYGGGFYVRSVYLIVSNSIFTRNKAKVGGGAIYIQEHTLFITNTVFTNNSARSGGVLSISNGTAQLSNITALYNVGYAQGVFYIHDTTTVISNSTFIGNSAMQLRYLESSVF